MKRFYFTAVLILSAPALGVGPTSSTPYHNPETMVWFDETGELKFPGPEEEKFCDKMVDYKYNPHGSNTPLAEELEHQLYTALVSNYFQNHQRLEIEFQGFLNNHN